MTRATDALNDALARLAKLEQDEATMTPPRKRQAGRYDRRAVTAIHPSTCDVCLQPITPPQLVIRQARDNAWIHARCAPGGDDE